MLYPFTHKIIGKFDNLIYQTHTELEINPSLNPDAISWRTFPITCTQISDWAATFENLTITNISITIGFECPWHIDLSKYKLAHRILIPVTDNFIWEFELDNGSIEQVIPVENNIYLFNNMIQHRFISTDQHKRATIRGDFYDSRIINRIEI